MEEYQNNLWCNNKNAVVRIKNHLEWEEIWEKIYTRKRNQIEECWVEFCSGQLIVRSMDSTYFSRWYPIDTLLNIQLIFFSIGDHTLDNSASFLALVFMIC